MTEILLGSKTRLLRRISVIQKAFRVCHRSFCPQAETDSSVMFNDYSLFVIAFLLIIESILLLQMSQPEKMGRNRKSVTSLGRHNVSHPQEIQITTDGRGLKNFLRYHPPVFEMTISGDE
jgi:hypothetical protein